MIAKLHGYVWGFLQVCKDYFTPPQNVMPMNENMRSENYS